MTTINNIKGNTYPSYYQKSKEANPKAITSNITHKPGISGVYPQLRGVDTEPVKDIFLNDLGDITVKYDEKPEIILTGDSEFPFVLNKDFKIEIELNGQPDKQYSINIPKGYKWDGASIPESLQPYIGENYAPEFALASMVHDYMCEEHSIIDDNMYLSTAVFCSLLKSNGVSEWKAGLMAFAVNIYQYIFGDWDDNQNISEEPKKLPQIPKSVTVVA